MSYATPVQWEARFHYLGTGLDGGVTQTILESYSRQLDQMMNRRSMEPKTVTNYRWKDRVRTGVWSTRYVHLPDYPPLYPEKWSQTLTSMSVLNCDGETKSEVNIAGCIQLPEQDGLVILPSGTFYSSGDYVQATYTCGYNPIPSELTEACIYLTRVHVFNTLGQQDPADVGKFYGKSDASAQVESLICPFKLLSIA